MITRYRLSLDGTPLDTLDQTIIIHDIAETVQQASRSATRPGPDGSFLTVSRRDTMTVTVTFEIHEPDTVRRQEICTRIAAWCSGSTLTVNTRPDRVLHVVCKQPPAISSALRYRDALTVDFVAYDVPFWQDVDKSTIAVVEGLGYIPGNTPTVMDVSATNASSETVADVMILCGTSSMRFEGVNLASGETLTITHTTGGLVRAMVGDRSVYATLTPESSDDLTVNPGSCPLRCDGLDAVFTCCGRWL